MKLFGRPTETDDYRFKELINLVKLAEYNNMEIDSITLSESAFSDLRPYIAEDIDGNKFIYGVKIKETISDMYLNIK